jgi:hypothetical protein
MGQPVILVKDQLDADLQGNLLRYVFTPDTFVNFLLVRSGYGYPSDDPCACIDMFVEMQMAASESEVGFSDWAALGPEFSGHPVYDYQTPTPAP